jgi:hypothetical protein
MKALEIVLRRQREIEMETTAPLRISASASFLNALVEEFPQVRRNGYDFAFEKVVVWLDLRLPRDSFLIETL